MRGPTPGRGRAWAKSSSSTKYNRQGSRARDDTEFHPGLFTFYDRENWVVTPASYVWSLGPTIWPDDDEPERPGRPAIRGSYPWPTSPRRDEGHGPKGLKPPPYAGPFGWLAAAACGNVPIDVLDFADPADRRSTFHALDICADCPVTDQCRRFRDVTESDPPGVWAGESSDKRVKYAYPNYVADRTRRAADSELRRRHRQTQIEAQRSATATAITHRIAALQAELDQLQSIQRHLESAS